MLPFEFTATPEASPRCMSGGSLMKFGTESKLSSGADVDCAKADGLISTKSPASNRFMINLPDGGSGGVVVGRLERPRRGRQYTNGQHCNTIDTCPDSLPDPRGRTKCLRWPWASPRSCLQPRLQALIRSPISTAGGRSA